MCFLFYCRNSEDKQYHQSHLINVTHSQTGAHLNTSTNSTNIYQQQKTGDVSEINSSNMLSQGNQSSGGASFYDGNSTNGSREIAATVIKMEVDNSNKPAQGTTNISSVAQTEIFQNKVTVPSLPMSTLTVTSVSTTTGQQLANVLNTNNTSTITVTANKAPKQDSASTAIIGGNKDVDLRKKRKRDQQKQRRQLPTTQLKDNSVNSAIGNNSSIANCNSNNNNIIGVNNSNANNLSIIGTISPGASTSASGVVNNKKRVRNKALKIEEDYDSFIDNLLQHMRQMQSLQILEPELHNCYSACPIYGWNQNVSPPSSTSQTNQARKSDEIQRSHHNELHSELLGEYGKAFMANRITEYDPTRPIIQKKQMEEANPIHNNYYDQEFSSFTGKSESERLLSLLKITKERAQSYDVTEIAYNSHSNKPDPNSELHRILHLGTIYQEPFPGLAFINEEQDESDRMSPVIPIIDPMALTTKPIRHLPEQLKSDDENDTSNKLENSDSKKG